MAKLLDVLGVRNKILIYCIMYGQSIMAPTIHSLTPIQCTIEFYI